MEEIRKQIQSHLSDAMTLCTTIKRRRASSVDWKIIHCMGNIANAMKDLQAVTTQEAEECGVSGQESSSVH